MSNPEHKLRVYKKYKEWELYKWESLINIYMF